MMEQVNVKFVGTEDNPIHIYWNLKSRKIDEYLLLLSICSGAYGMEYLDKDSFKSLCNKYFRYTKKSDSYDGQFKFVLFNGNEDCSQFLRDLLFDKWNFVYEYNSEEIMVA